MLSLTPLYDEEGFFDHAQVAADVGYFLRRAEEESVAAILADEVGEERRRRVGVRRRDQPVRVAPVADDVRRPGGPWAHRPPRRPSSSARTCVIAGMTVSWM